MDVKEGGSVSRPPVLDGTNYDYWKARMTALLKSIDNKTWRAIVKGSTPPVNKTTGESSTTTLEYKKEEDWTKEEEEEALANSKALNAIFNGVDKNMFRLINTCSRDHQ